MPVAPLPRAALLDVRGVMRALYRVRVAAGADELELRRWRDLGAEVVRLLRRARWGTDAGLWADARLRLRLVLGVTRELPAELAGVHALLEAAARPILTAPEQPGETAVETTGGTMAPPDATSPGPRR